MRDLKKTDHGRARSMSKGVGMRAVVEHDELIKLEGTDVANVSPTFDQGLGYLQITNYLKKSPL